MMSYRLIRHWNTSAITHRGINLSSPILPPSTACIGSTLVSLGFTFYALVYQKIGERGNIILMCVCVTQICQSCSIAAPLIAQLSFLASMCDLGRLSRPADSLAWCRLRSASSSILVVRRTRLTTVHGWSVKVDASHVWDNLPQHVITSPSSFRRFLKTL